MNEQAGRDELARQVTATRVRMFGTVTKALQEADMARGTWDNIEAGKPVKPNSLRALEKRLGWPLYYADEVIAGRTSSFRDDIVASQKITDETRAALLALYDELESGEEGVS